MEALALHIGTHKTGSSAIQAAFARGELPTGVMYPSAGQISSGGHLNLAWEAIGDRRFRAERGTTSDMIAEVRATAPEMLILSAETFSVRPGESVVADWASRLVATFQPERVIIVGYVRPQWSYLESHYTQMVKTGVTGDTFSRFLVREKERLIFDYPLLFRSWRQEFGDDLQVRPYTSNVVSDICGVLGLEPPATDPRVNVRPGAKQMEMLRHLRLQLDEQIPEPGRLFSWAKNRLAEEYPNDEPFRCLTPEHARELGERFAEGNALLADTFWGGVLPDEFRPPRQTRTHTWSLDQATDHDRKVFEALVTTARSRLLQEQGSAT